MSGRRIPADLRELLRPFGDALADVAKKAIDSAVDTALGEAEARVQGVASAVADVRKRVSRRYVNGAAAPMARGRRARE